MVSPLTIKIEEGYFPTEWNAIQNHMNDIHVRDRSCLNTIHHLQPVRDSSLGPNSDACKLSLEELFSSFQEAKWYSYNSGPLPHYAQKIWHMNNSYFHDLWDAPLRPKIVTLRRKKILTKATRLTPNNSRWTHYTVVRKQWQVKSLHRDLFKTEFLYKSRNRLEYRE